MMRTRTAIEINAGRLPWNRMGRAAAGGAA